MGLREHRRPMSVIPRITLSQKHIPEIRRPAITFQPSDRLPNTILTLTPTQITHALRHSLHFPCPTHSVRPTRPHQRPQHRIPPPHRLLLIPHRRPTLLQHHRLLLHPQKARVIVLHIAPLQLQRPTAGVGAEPAQLGHGACDASGAVRHRQVATALVQPVQHVLWGGALDCVVVVGGVCG